MKVTHISFFACEINSVVGSLISQALSVNFGYLITNLQVGDTAVT